MPLLHTASPSLSDPPTIAYFKHLILKEARRLEENEKTFASLGIDKVTREEFRRLSPNDIENISQQNFGDLSEAYTGTLREGILPQCGRITAIREPWEQDSRFSIQTAEAVIKTYGGIKHTPSSRCSHRVDKAFNLPPEFFPAMKERYLKSQQEKDKDHKSK